MAKTRRNNLPPANRTLPQISRVEEEKFMGIMRQIGDNSLNNMSPESKTDAGQASMTSERR